MKVNIYLKSGQTLVLDHIDDLTTTRNKISGELTGYEWTYKDLPAKAVKLHTIEIDQIAAITTENR